ncbi:MAG: leucine-rich repeat protein, partial [Segatella oris]|uniref:leucine-rich repeat protein n=1 Tax=Segatella oris TaxID=28135 RepID=UPI003FA1C92D
MKKIVMLFLCLAAVMSVMAQSATFLVPTPEGVPLYYEITDKPNKKVSLVQNPNTVSPPYPHYAKVIVPEKITYKGETYDVTLVDHFGLGPMAVDSLSLPANLKFEWQPFVDCKLKSLYLPKNLEVLPNNFLWYSVIGEYSVEEIWINPALKTMEQFCVCSATKNIKHLRGFANSHIEKIQTMAFVPIPMETELIKDLSVLPPTIRILESRCFGTPMPLDKVVIPASMENIGNAVYNISNDVYIKGSNPFTLGTTPFGSQSTLKIHVPVDRSYAFKSAANWASYADKIVEDLQIGATGYTTYYLENENFLIPAGCTAYIITGVTPSGSITTPDQAVVKAFTAGKIIPKKTGFILQGTPNSTVVYQANVTGTEEDVTGNLLVGTATEQQFSLAGHKFYVLASGDQGLGFYKQGTRGGASIKLKPHRAGLRLDESIGRAKSLIF